VGRVELHRALGLTDDEAASIEKILSRPPNDLELAMYSVMWSEHCSYKSSRLHLRRLPTEGPHVIVGPGENAGVIDAGDGIAVAIRIESHNHPSAVEPYQGAATGVGGILRDIFTMGARPIALMDSLRFGDLSDARSRWIFEGVVNGISGYGNAVGVPTVGGELGFDATYAENPLVNVLCLGVMPRNRLVLGRASGPGNLAVLLGSSTGRDGIGGVSVLASAGFGENDGAKRPSVQVGDPFEEKRLIEACLELLDAGIVVGVQDLGGAGLTCATSETASRGGVGMDVNVAAVPRREQGMTPVEVMTSESQERMLAIVRPDDLDTALVTCERWGVTATVVGQVTEADRDGEGRLRILDGWDGDVLADVPAASLHDLAPLYDRPLEPPADLAERQAQDPSQLPAPVDAGEDLLAMLMDPSWVYGQYDHQLFLNTVAGPGGDAALLRLKAPGLPRSQRALALSTDGAGRACAVDPRGGAALSVAEAALNVACVGARPAAVVNCLNLGNPEHPEVMWQLSEVVDGMTAACLALELPVVGGNVSLYNESRGRDIDPTPVIGVVGFTDDLDCVPPGARFDEGDTLLLLGPAGERGLGGSLWARRQDHEGGVLPALDLAAHAHLIAAVIEIVGVDGVSGIHDVSDGGLGVCLAEMAIRSGTGFRVDGIEDHEQLFSEAPSRVVVAVTGPGVSRVGEVAAAHAVSLSTLGVAGGARLIVGDLVDIELAHARDRWRWSLEALVHG
jgi:phosphoribosylformylglycinamidine synthase II